MSKNYELIERLAYKFNQGSISTDELKTLTDWYNSHNDEQVTIVTESDSAASVKSRMMEVISQKIKEEPSEISVKRLHRSSWISAAAAILLLTLGTWAILSNRKSTEQQNLAQQQIVPGGNKATLVLEDGREIVLSNNQAGIISNKAVTYADGESIGDINPELTTQVFTLRTPRGGTYKVTLPDGTQAWLNAQSTLKYPSTFAAEQRVVELEGEAYFEVKAAYKADGSKIPFKVQSRQQLVEVLGTKFNMSCYEDQLDARTTLVEGKVAVANANGRFMLKPNEQAITLNNKTTVREVASEHYIAWQQGKFSFDGKTLKETLQEIGRWYNLDIIYEKTIPNEELIGDAFRNQNIHLVLRLLEVAEIDYHLDVRSRKLIIKGKK